MPLNADLVASVWRRAQSRCEYCQLSSALYPAPFQIDHIVARQHGGATVSENLALACIHCNRYKGPNIAGIDPENGALSHRNRKVAAKAPVSCATMNSGSSAG